MAKKKQLRLGHRAERDWSPDEVRVIVADYFEMLRHDMLNEKCNKTAHRRELIARLDNRSTSAIEYKHRNISAAMVELGYPYIDGYKPLSGYQRRELPAAIEAYLSSHAGFFEGLIDSPRMTPAATPPIASTNSILESAPEEIPRRDASGKPWLSLKGQRVDFALRDAVNRITSKLGEEFALEFERQRLREAGREDLAKRVDWVSQTIGDGLGFDILSFDEINSSKRYVEVKTTTFGKSFPFYVTATEVRCSEDLNLSYHLYRVFNISRSARLYIVPGALSAMWHLQPEHYIATT